jgi:BASS family bile acid:Na+ symporter
MLSLVVFVPIVAVELLRRTAPSAVQALMRRRFPISLAVFAIINMGVFSKYSRFFNQNPETILEALWVGIALAGLFVILGIASQWRSSVENQLAAAVSLGNMNNVLVIVFAAQFFGPLEPTLSAVYMIPFFGLILPLRVYRRLRIPDDG